MSRASALLVAALALAGCGKSAPVPRPEVPLPEPRAAAAEPDPSPAPTSAPEADAAAPLASAGADAAVVPDARLAPPELAPRNGPVVDDADAVARASRAADVALDRAYAEYVKKVKISASHGKTWVKAPTEVRGNAKSGWDVAFASHPPAGFEHDCLVHVSPKGEITVKHARASFSSD